MNIMARKLDDRMTTINNQRNELKAILSGLSEGVIAIDQNERIIDLNEAAADLLGIDLKKASGASFQEAIRYANLQQFVQKISDERAKNETELTIYGTTENASKFTAMFWTAQKMSRSEF